MSDFDTIIHALYLVAAVCFVAGLHLMNSPASARRGNQVSAAGMVLAFVAMVFGAMNVVGGYVVTDRMLQMFRKKPTAPKATTEGADGAPGA